VARRINAAPFSTIERHIQFPRLEANEDFITAQQVRNIRASLRAMEDNSKSSVDDSQVQERHRRVDTEHRGVTGTLVLTDVLDEKVPIPEELFDLAG